MTSTVRVVQFAEPAMDTEWTESNNPNLDGDFVALKEAQKIRKSHQKDGQLKPLTDTLSSVREDDKDLISSPINAEYVKIRNALFSTAAKDNVNECEQCLKKIQSLNKTLLDPEFRDPDSNATVLHHALEANCFKVAEWLCDLENDKLLTSEYNITVKKITSTKTALHILTEKGKTSLIEYLLNKIQNDPEKEGFLRKTVLMELEGQRPRHLAAIHIAALKGNTDLVERFVKLGVNVNSTNNKNDTPVLWAARGNHNETVEKLIELGADLNHQNDKGSTPFYWAVRYGFKDLLETLIDKGKVNIHQKRKLGLISPIVLASALGYAEIVALLCKNSADVHTRITGGKTAMHYAASLGNTNVIEVLLMYKADVNVTDDMGNTPLLVATRGKHIPTINCLVTNGANLDCKNRSGETVWDYAIDCPDDNLLKVIIELYKKAKRLSGRKIIFPAGKTPLHVAALKGDCHKLRCLLSYGVDPNNEDQNGNTYFHLAARDNSLQVLAEFIDDVDPNCQNGDGDTPLHISSKHGHLQAVEILLKKAKLETRNNMGETPLHVAAKSSLASCEVVDRLVDVIVKTNNWSLVDQTDERGNSALHVAARYGRTDIMNSLEPLNPTILNNEGESPLHIAAKSSAPEVLESLLATFNRPGKGLNIDLQNSCGESLLHIAAEKGDCDQVNMLIKGGGDLALKDNDGNSVLHALSLMIVTDTSNKEALLEVFLTIAHSTPIWWCIQNDLHCPDEDSELYETYKKTAMIYLTSQLMNKEELSMIGYATKLGATDLIKTVLSLPGIYCFRTHKHYLFDVTSLTPETHISSAIPQIGSSQIISFNKVDVMKMDYNDNPVEPVSSNTKSLLDIIVQLENDILATEMMDVVPIKQLVRNYWSAYQSIYFSLMVIHITYMSLFSGYAIPLTTGSGQSSNDCANGQGALIGLFLIYPACLLIFEIYYGSVGIYKGCQRISENKRHAKDDNKKTKFCSCSGIRPLSWPWRFMNWVINNLDHWACCAFLSLVTIWYILICTNMSAQIYVLSAALIVGWLFTISFTKGFETVHSYSIMLAHIVVNDITRFIFLYLFVLLAFSFGLHALFQIPSSVAENYSHPLESMFLTFNLMIGMGELFDDTFDDSYEKAGSSSIWVKVVYIIYIIIAMIIFLNLLIAMMSDTYGRIKSREGTAWRAGSLRLALQIESSMPFIRKIFRAVGVVKDETWIDPQTKRWMIKIPASEIDNLEKLTLGDETAKSIQRLESKMNSLATHYGDVLRRIDNLAADMNNIFESHAQGLGGTARIGIPKNRPSSRMGRTVEKLKLKSRTIGALQNESQANRH